MVRGLAVLVTFLVMTVGTRAAAYNYESPLGDPCHEGPTVKVLRKLRKELSTAAPLATSGDDALIVDDVVFTLDSDMRDIGAATLLIGVRDNDVKGHSGIDSQELARIHGEEHTQDEHCLRRSSHDEPGGSEHAATACREEVRRRLHQAIDDGLSPDGSVNLAARTSLAVSLAFRGRTTLSLPTFYVRLGQAVHTLQDSFSHTFRTADHRRITVVLNWVEFIEGDHDEARDGPAHMRDLDLCRDIDPFRRDRLAVMGEATEAVMRAALDPELTADEKKAAVDEALEAYMGFEPGCTIDNGWCGAPEVRYRDDACGCRAVGDRGSTRAWWLVAMVLPLWLRRSGRRRRTGAAAVLLTVWLGAGEARAHDEPPVDRTGFGLHSAFAGAIDNGAMAWSLGGRYAVSNRWLFGLDAEYNPWFDIESARVARGAFNGYLTVIYRHEIGRHWALRITVNAGVSVLLFDLVGAPMGSVGPMVGANLLGISYELADQIYLVLDPAHVVMPVPQIQGAPFSYHQYRLAIGVQLGA